MSGPSETPRKQRASYLWCGNSARSALAALPRAGYKRQRAPGPILGQKKTSEILPWLGVGLVQACANAGLSALEPTVVQIGKQA